MPARDGRKSRRHQLVAWRAFGRATFFWIKCLRGAQAGSRFIRRGGRLERFHSGGFPLTRGDCMEIKRIGVVGAGTMGNGIAHVFARSGYSVVLCDVGQRFLDRGLETITKNLDREVAKSKITADDKAATLKRITAAIERKKLADCDFVVEAATEKFEIKTEIFRDLDKTCCPEV